MIPILTPAEMAEVDAAAAEPVEVLIERAGFAVARSALALMGGAYGRRVVVIAGPGNNGRDGAVAGRLLARRGAAVIVREASDPGSIPPCDLVIDAAYGTGFRGSYTAPDVGGAPVLAVDIPSGVDGLTGLASGRPAAAVATTTFAALKPGLLFADGAALSGPVTVADIGLEPLPHQDGLAGLVETSDLAVWVRRRPTDAHKWKSAVWIVGGSAEMTGAPVLSASGALAAGAGYVRLSAPGLAPLGRAPIEAVFHPLAMVGWHRTVLAESERISALVVGPGLGRNDSVRDEVAALATSSPLPVVVDGDGLWAISDLRGRMSEAPRVLTPHDGEYLQLTGRPVGADRIAAARRLAAERSAVVLLKGPTTVIAEPRGRVRLVRAGDERLASAGTGDVLSGIVGALLAAGADPFDAAAAGAQVHGLAGRACPVVGTTASQLPAAVSAVLSKVVTEHGGSAEAGR
ncbi:MAG: NAD(P)H-hydrate dehydratase [Acidimicrobiales bacterium]